MIPAPPTRLERVTYGLGKRGLTESHAGVNPDWWRSGGLRSEVAARLANALRALGAGEPFAMRLLIEAAEEAAALLGAADAAVEGEEAVG